MVMKNYLTTFSNYKRILLGDVQIGDVISVISPSEGYKYIINGKFYRDHGSNDIEWSLHPYKHKIIELNDAINNVIVILDKASEQFRKSQSMLIFVSAENRIMKCTGKKSDTVILIHRNE